MALTKAVPLIVNHVAANPAAPSVTNEGTPGVTAYSYKLVAKMADGSRTAASSAGSTATGNATLDGTNFNRLTWTDPAFDGTIDKIEIYRTASGGTPSSTGKIGEVNAGVQTFDDTGLAGDSVIPPTTNGTGYSQAFDASVYSSFAVYAPGANGTKYTFSTWFSAKDAPASTDWILVGSALTFLSTSQNVPAYRVRIQITAYTAGDLSADGLHVVGLYANQGG